MALLAGELSLQDRLGMLQVLMNDFPEIPQNVIDGVLLKNNGDVHQARQELEAVSARYLFGTGVQTPSPTSTPQSPIRYPTTYTPPSGRRTPSSSGSRTPSTPGTPPTMDPFRREQLGGPIPHTGQPKLGSYVSQLRVTPTQPPSRPNSGSDQDGLINGTNSASSSTGGGTPSSTPTKDKPPPRFSSPPASSGVDEHFSIDDEFPTQFSLTPTGPSPSDTKRPIEIQTPPYDRQISTHEVRFGPSDSRYSNQPPTNRQLMFDDRNQRTHADPYQQRTYDDRSQHRVYDDRSLRTYDDRSLRTYDDRSPRTYDDRSPRTYDDRSPRTYDDGRPVHPGQYPVHRWSTTGVPINGPNPMQHASQDIYTDPRSGYSPRYDPRSEPRPIQQYYSPHQTHIPVSQSVPNLDQQFVYSPRQPRDEYHLQSPLKHAKSSQNVSHETFTPVLIPAEVRPPEVVRSKQVIHPSPHSPPKQAAHISRPLSASHDQNAIMDAAQISRPHSTSYDSRGNQNAIMDATQSMLVFPTDSGDKRVKHIQEAWIPTTGSGDHDNFLSLQLPKPNHEDDEYTQALIRHQKARFDKLYQDLHDEKKKLERYRREVQHMESEISQKSNRRAPFPTTEQVNTLRQEKRQLQIDIECMSREIELHKRQGLVSPTHHISFYDNMSTTGQSGRIPPKTAPHVPVPLPYPPTPPPPQPHEQPPPTSPTLEPDEGQHWSCNYCTFLNHPALDKCECCEMPRM